MKKQLFKKGFKAVAEETERREKAKLAKQGKLFRFYLKKGDEDIPIRFLTEEPICFWEHTIKEGTNFSNYPCIGDDCEHCADGDKPRYVSAWLIVDQREVTFTDKESGKEKTVKDRIKLLVRGMKDAAQLERLSKKYGLTDRCYAVTRTGEGTATAWNFDRGDNDELSKKQEDALRAQLPENIRDWEWEDIIIKQIESSEEEETTTPPVKKEDVKVEEPEAIEDEDEADDEDEAPAKKTVRKPAKKALPTGTKVGK